jgi:hypothetical protein
MPSYAQQEILNFYSPPTSTYSTERHQTSSLIDDFANYRIKWSQDLESIVQRKAIKSGKNGLQKPMADLSLKDPKEPKKTVEDKKAIDTRNTFKKETKK